MTELHHLTLAELKTMGIETVAMVLQCSGNGRGFFPSKPSGTPWTVGAAGCVVDFVIGLFVVEDYLVDRFARHQADADQEEQRGDEIDGDVVQARTHALGTAAVLILAPKRPLTVTVVVSASSSGSMLTISSPPKRPASTLQPRQRKTPLTVHLSRICERW